MSLIKEQMESLESVIEDAKKVQLKVNTSNKLTKEKEEELVRLRVEKTRLRDQLKAELREDFEEQKDKIIIDARNELAFEK